MPKISAVKREANRQRILDAALSCFAREGFHNTTIADIVRESGVSQGAVYLYFPNKEEIILALGDDRLQADAQVNAMAGANQDPVEGLLSLIAFHARTLDRAGDRDPLRVRVQAWAEALRNPVIRERTIAGLATVRAAIETLIERGRRTGQIRDEVDPDAVARVITATFQGLVLQVAWGDSVDLPGWGQVIRGLIESLLTDKGLARWRALHHASSKD